MGGRLKHETLSLLVGDGLNVGHRNSWPLKLPATHCWPSTSIPNTAFFLYWFVSWPLAFTDSERKQGVMGGRMACPPLSQGAPLAHSHSHFLTCCVRLWFVCELRLVSLATAACQGLPIPSSLVAEWGCKGKGVVLGARVAEGVILRSGCHFFWAKLSSLLYKEHYICF